DGTTVADTETVAVSGNGTYTTPTGFLPTATTYGAGTYQWVASYSGDTNNNAISSPNGAEPESVLQGNLTKTADSATVAVPNPAGYTVTISVIGPPSNALGPVTVTGVTFSDPLPAGAGNDLSWSIFSQSTVGGVSNAFSISGTTPNQTLVFSPTSIAGGVSY